MKKKIIISIAVIAIIAIAAVLCIKLLPSKATPEEIIELQINQIAENAGKSLDAVKTVDFNANVNSDMVLKSTVTIGDDIINTLSTASGLDLSFLKALNIDADMSVRSDIIKYILSLGIDGKHLVSADALIDYNAMRVYMTLPELNKTPLMINMLSEDTQSIDANAVIEQMTDIIDALPDGEKAKALLVSYFDVFTDNLGEIAAEEYELSVNGSEIPVTKADIVITEEKAKKICTEFLTKLKNDEELWGIVSNLASVIAPEAEDLLKEERNELNNSFDTVLSDALSELDGMEDVTYTLYIDGNNIIGAKLTAEEIVSEAYTLKQKDSNYHYLSLTQNGEPILSLTLDGKTDNGSYSGNANVIFESRQVLTADIENFDTESLSSGKITLRLGNGLAEKLEKAQKSVDAFWLETFGLPFEISLSDLALEYEFNSVKTDDGNSTGTAKIALSENGKTVFAVNASADVAINVTNELEIPANAIDTSDGNAMLEWSSKLNFTSIIENLPESVKNIILTAMMGAQPQYY